MHAYSLAKAFESESDIPPTHDDARLSVRIAESSAFSMHDSNYYMVKVQVLPTLTSLLQNSWG
jgi:hypothetical protein